MKKLAWFNHNKYEYTKPAIDNSIDEVEQAARKLGLEYNFECIKYLLDIEKISFGQLRCAQFFNGHDYYYDTNRAAYYLVLAGLVGSKQEDKHNTEALEEHTYKILNTWMEKQGPLSLLYIQLIKQLEERHFFMTSAALTTLEKMSSTSSYKSYAELIKSVLAQEMKEQMQLSHTQTSLMNHILDITTI